MQPKVLILDEPGAGLDPKGKQSILNMLVRFKEAGKRTVILITHHMDDVAEYADKVLVLDQGRLKWHTDPFTLFTRHKRELEDLGLELPQSVQFIEELNSKLAVPLDYRSVKKEEIIQQIALALRKKEMCDESIY